jgi:serine/threonine-protein kinase
MALGTPLASGLDENASIAQNTQAMVAADPGKSRLRAASTQPTRPKATSRGPGAPQGRVRLSPGVIVPGMRYKITGWLGDGAMGVVYEAVHLDIGRHAALKVLHEALTTDRTEVEAFWEEARAATKIGSPYIVEIYDMAELPDGRLVSVMELLNGHTLEQEVQNTPIRPGRLISVLRQACKGLAAAHDEGIVHRDIKPANIFLRAANVKTKERSDRLSILDFGLAVILTGDAHGRELMGTPYYMAP